MKKTLILLFISFCLSNAKAQWEWSNPQPSGYSDTKVLFTDALTGYIINSNGDLIKTTDGGTNWKIQQNFPGCSILDAQDSVFVIAGMNNNIYISNDKAQTWHKSFFQNNPFVINIDIISKDTISLVSGNTGFTQLFLSVDGGQTWGLVNDSFVIKSVDYINSKLAFAASYGGIYKSTDGGKKWQNIYTPSGGYSFTQVKFWDDKIGYAYQDLGSVLKTKDGGITWTLSLTDFSERVEAIHFVNAQTAFVGGQEGSLYRTDDGGNSWQYLNLEQTGYGQAIYSICFLDQNEGFVVGQRGKILKTTNGGASWQNYAPSYTEMKALSFPTPSIGYAASWYNLFKTEDAGKTWTQLPFSLPDHNDRFQYLHFFNRDTGILLAQDPVQLYKTYDGGQTWRTLSLPLQQKDYLKGVYFIKDTGYLNINGIYYSMLQTRDAAESWQSQYNFIQSAGYTNLFFVDSKTGYGTQGPYLYKTTDSAKTWNLVKVQNNNYAFNAIWFTSPATGFVMGDDGGNLKTVDSGKTWTQINIIPGNPNFEDIYSLRFFNKKLGYFSTRLNGSIWGGIYKTIDGGTNWKLDKKIPWECKAIEMTSDSTLYIAGEYGTILKKDMREYDLDSLTALDSECLSQFSCQVSAVLSTIDSVWFQYGTAGFTQQILATPSGVTDSTIKARATVQNLSSDSTYTLRVKILYNNNYYYSNELPFQPIGLPKPVIYSNGSLLASSASEGNQWFLNNTAITGATGATYQPAASGTYTVQQKRNGCTSPMSAGFNFIVTAVNDPVLTKEISIFPNPVDNVLFINNAMAKKLHITLYDEGGRVLREWQTQKVEDSFNIQTLAPSFYILTIEEITTHKKMQAKLLKW